MKNSKLNLISIFLIFFLLFSCSEAVPTQFDIVKSKIESNLLPKLNDPESYEFVKLELVDSVLFKDNIEFRKKSFNQDLQSNREDLEWQLEMKTDVPTLYDEQKATEIEGKILRIKNILADIDSLELSLGINKSSVTSYTYTFSYRGNNAMGAKVLNEYIVQTNSSPDFNVINITDDLDKVILNPNDFPGYKETISKYF